MRLITAFLLLVLFLSPDISYSQVDKRIDKSKYKKYKQYEKAERKNAEYSRQNYRQLKKDTIMTILWDGSVKMSYPDGSWRIVGEYNQYYSPVTGDTIGSVPYTNVQGITPPKQISGFQNVNEKKWKETLDLWLKDHAVNLMQQIEFLLKNNKAHLKQYRDSEKKNCENIYEVVDFRGKFIVRMKSFVVLKE